jgi:hypothetical protein
VKEDRMERPCSTNGEEKVEMINACRLLMVISGGKKSLGKPRRRRMDNIKMDLGNV